MSRILIVGISAKSGGGRSILTNLLTVLKTEGSPHKFFVLVPDNGSYSEFASKKIKIISMMALSQTFFLPFVNAVILPYLVKKLNCDVIFNLADIPIPTQSRQLFLFDWPYAAYPESLAWSLSDRKTRIIRKFKLFLFKRYLPYVNQMVAQSAVIKNRLEKIYGIQGIVVVPNAVSLDNLSESVNHDFNLGSGFKLLCLSRYYSHKNIEVFLPLAEKIRDGGYDIKIVTTISIDQGKGAESFLDAINSRSLDKVIINIGPVAMKLVPSLYRQTDGLLLPTLLESFSGTYVEAMFHRKPIFTSNLDFATSICGNAAYYFDPHDPGEIFKQLLTCQTDFDTLESKLKEGTRILENMPTWKDVFYMYISLIEDLECNAI